VVEGGRRRSARLASVQQPEAAPLPPAPGAAEQASGCPQRASA
jgi:hypothetical protein